MKSHASLAALLLFLGSCSKHPLEGGWHEHMADGKHGYELEFVPDSSALSVHGRPRADGTHDHPSDGTYTLSGDALTLAWTEEGKKLEFRGTLKGDRIEVTGAGGQKLEFHRGGGH